MGEVHQQHLARPVSIAPRAGPAPQGPRRSVLVKPAGCLAGLGQVGMAVAEQVIIRAQDARQRPHHLRMRQYLRKCRNLLVDGVAGVFALDKGGAGLRTNRSVDLRVDRGVEEMVPPRNKGEHLVVVESKVHRVLLVDCL